MRIKWAGRVKLKTWNVARVRRKYSEPTFKENLTQKKHSSELLADLRKLNRVNKDCQNVCNKIDAVYHGVCHNLKRPYLGSVSEQTLEYQNKIE